MRQLFEIDFEYYVLPNQLIEWYCFNLVFLLIRNLLLLGTVLFVIYKIYKQIKEANEINEKLSSSIVNLPSLSADALPYILHILKLSSK